MLRSSIRTKILGIALGLIVLMIATAILSMSATTQVGRRLEQLNASDIPAYGALARANIRSLERALELRRMIIARLTRLPDPESYAERRRRFEALGLEEESEARAAQVLIRRLIAEPQAYADPVALARLDTRLAGVLDDDRRHLGDEIARLLRALDAGDHAGIADGIARVETLRDEIDRKIDGIRAEMRATLESDATRTAAKQHEVMLVAALITALAAAIGIAFALLVSAGVTRPVRRLVAATVDVEAGRLDAPVPVTTRDEVGRLTESFNRMVGQLRLKERIREVFGKYVDPRIVEGLIDRPVLAAGGQRRVMTVLFCDLQGFTSLSEGMTPQGLVTVMNRYFSTMSAPIREQSGVIDKYIGDAIMAFWGPPFTEDADQASLACLAAAEMLDRVAPLRAALPDLLGVRNTPAIDLRIGIATGEVLVGSIGSELMMSYTVMGDTVNLASRLEGANKVYGTRLLVSAATARAAGDRLALREIDRLVVVGQSEPQTVFEVMGRQDALGAAARTLQARYAEGLAAYRAQDWPAARAGFTAALAAVPDDGPCRAMLRRIDTVADRGLPPDWDGVWRLAEK